MNIPNYLFCLLIAITCQNLNLNPVIIISVSLILNQVSTKARVFDHDKTKNITF